MADRPSASPPPRPRAGGAPGGAGGPRIGNLPISAVIVIVIAVAVLVWLLFIRGDSNSNDTGVGKTIDLVSAAALPGEVTNVGYPVYWLGPRPGVQYEVTLITDGRTYIRYLPKGEKAGSANPYLTVASYAQNNAYDVLEGLGKRPGSRTVDVSNAGLVLSSEDKPSGVYAAFPGADTQIEIFDPKPGRAFDLARSGALTPIG